MDLNLRPLKGLEKIGAVLCFTAMFLIFAASLALFALAHPKGAAELLRGVLYISLFLMIVGGLLIGWMHFKTDK
jgi:hypothetical protein